jgi:hypothetical protein
MMSDESGAPLAGQKRFTREQKTELVSVQGIDARNNKQQITLPIFAIRL